MKAAIIENGTVTNVVKVLDQAFADSQGWIVSDAARIGDLYDGTTFTTPGPYHGLSAEQAAAKKRGEIDSDFQSGASSLKGDYTEDEIKSWDKQEQEARAWTADNTTPTPLLSAMVAQRGDTVAALAAKVIANSDAWTAAYGQILGTKYAREAALAAIDLAATDALAQIEAV